jgi:1-acyl-sn-glycerol-3-phosphate acyltransferase
MTRFLRGTFFLLLIRPVLALVLGANVRGRAHLPRKGPAVIVANHNSHLDTLTILALFCL